MTNRETLLKQTQMLMGENNNTISNEIDRSYILSRHKDNEISNNK